MGSAAGFAVAGCAVLSCLLAGCGEIEFYWQGVAGQADLLARAKPIDEVIAATPDPELKARLARAQAIRAFASRELALPDNRSYTSYADLGRPYAVWNVFAAPELSLTPRQWCFPVAGCVAYRGYFAESDARAEAARLAAAGDDVHLGGVPAYSTLGYFDDPVLSTFVRYREVELARLIFHELAHQVVYVKDDTSFNESFATAVEEAGIARWLAAEAAHRDPVEAAQLAADAARGQRLRAAFRALVAATRDRLTALYASAASDAEKRAGKAAAFAAMRAEYERAEGGSRRRLVARPLVRRRREQRRHRGGGAVRRSGAAVHRAARGGRRRPPAVLRAGQGAGGDAPGRARGGSRHRGCRLVANSPDRALRRISVSHYVSACFAERKRAILINSLASPRADRGRPPGGADDRRPPHHDQKECSACVTTKWFSSCIPIRASRCPR